MSFSDFLKTLGKIIRNNTCPFALGMLTGGCITILYKDYINYTNIIIQNKLQMQPDNRGNSTHDDFVRYPASPGNRSNAQDDVGARSIVILPLSSSNLTSQSDYGRLLSGLHQDQNSIQNYHGYNYTDHTIPRIHPKHE